MALQAYAITTVEKVTSYLRISGATSEQSTWFEDQINSVSGYIEHYCQRVFAVQSFSGEIHNGNGRSKIRTLYFPITQLSTATTPSDANKLASVQERADVDSAWEDVEDNVNNLLINNPKDYQLTSQNSHNIELVGGTFAEGNRNIKLSYQAGLTSPDIDEIEQVAIEMVAIRYKESGVKGSILGISTTNDSVSGRSGNVVYKDMKPEWKKILDRYKRKF